MTSNRTLKLVQTVEGIYCFSQSESPEMGRVCSLDAGFSFISLQCGPHRGPAHPCLVGHLSGGL